jgi:hypothetical protein
MTLREFCEVGGYQDMPQGLRVKVGKRAGQLFKAAMRGRTNPSKITWHFDGEKFHRTHVKVYTFGLLRQALDDVMSGELDRAKKLDQPKRRRPRKIIAPSPAE